LRVAGKDGGAAELSNGDFGSATLPPQDWCQSEAAVVDGCVVLASAAATVLVAGTGFGYASGKELVAAAGTGVQLDTTPDFEASVVLAAGVRVGTVPYGDD
jgi:hypothetical protein